jgi:hypothetical protein
MPAFAYHVHVLKELGMSKMNMVLLFIGLPACLCCGQTEKLYYKMTPAEIDRDMRQTAQKMPSYRERMVYYSGCFLGAPYVLGCEGEGACARYETGPLMNLRQMNCMTNCEIVLAFSLSDFYEEMFNVLQHIRYRYGLISMETRNHYTMADWLPANEWCLQDVTESAGGEDALPLTRTISHSSFFAGKGINDLPHMMPDREVTIHYVPLAMLPRHEEALQSGDIVSLIQDKPGIFSAHMLLIIKKDGKTYFRHASSSAKKVLDQPFAGYIAGLQKSKKYMGMSFMRVREQIQFQQGVYTHGKIIWPPKAME